MSSILRAALFSITVVTCLAWAMPAAAQQGWTGEVTDLAESPGSGDLFDPGRIAVDPEGNVLAVWAWAGRIQAARFTRASRTWSQPVDIGLGEDPTLLMDSWANAIAIWEGAGYLYAAHYVAATGRWSGAAAHRVGFWADTTHYRAIIDGAGNATVAWEENYSTVWAGRYSASSGTWTSSLLSAEGATGAPDLGVDAAGNVTAIWNGDVERYIHWGPPYYESVWATKVLAARFTPATGTWGPVIHLDSAPVVSDAQVAVDVEGNVTAMWRSHDSLGSTIHAARYTAATGALSAPVALARGSAASPILKCNPAGKVVAIWALRSPGAAQYLVQASAFHPASGTWTPPATLSAPGSNTSELGLAVDAQGNATVLWFASGPYQNDVVWASRHSAITGTWNGAVELASGFNLSFPQLAWDPAGNVLAYWQRYELRSGYALEAARWSAGTGTWGAVTQVTQAVAHGSLRMEWPEIAFDAAGNAMVIWRQQLCCSGPTLLKTTQWLATPAAPVIADVDIGDGTLSVEFTPPATSDPAFVPLNFDYSIDDGATWIARVPASTSSPLVIPSLRSGTLYGVRLRAVNVAGAGAASARAWSSPGPAPGPPVDVTATVTGTTVTVRWTPAPFTVQPASYLVEGGLQPGTTAVTFATDGTQYTLAAPIDTFFLRVRAVAGTLQSAPSQEIRVYVFTPGPPTDLTSAVVGNRVTLSWKTAPNSVAPTGYVVEGGLHPGQVLASLPTGSAATQFSFIAPSGLYSVRVHAVNGALRGTASNEVSVGVRPTAPRLLGLSSPGSTLVLSWMNADSGALTAGLILNVQGPVDTSLALPPAAESFTFTGVPTSFKSIYKFWLTAVNGAGMSARSNSVSLSFPESCFAADKRPARPDNFHATRSGSVITATWDLPLSGAAVTEYSVEVTGSYSGTFATTARSISGTVGPGSYTISVAARNPCGTGPPTAAQTVVVP